MRSTIDTDLLAFKFLWKKMTCAPCVSTVRRFETARFNLKSLW